MTGTDDAQLWVVLDELFNIGVTIEAADEGPGEVAFYGRCSTEDNQDPATSRGWQLSNARKFVEPLGGRVVAEFFDVGQSRSVPWERRPEAGRLLAQLKRPGRGWGAVVVGEGTRCWFGNQFSLVAPRFTAYGVDLWVPELGGRFEARNPSHTMLMSVLGGMSASERQHVQVRVRAAMDAQVRNEGRYQGGRAPYGYRVVDAGPHPNPRKACEGYRLRALALDEPAAGVVRRIFAEYLEGMGDRAIANGLNRDGVVCPSALRPEQNRHRVGDGWQGSTVRSILENPRYTGYAVFGRWTKHEELLDPDDVAAGHMVRFRRSSQDRVVRSRRPAHPPIVSVGQFTRVQILRRSRAAAGFRGICKLERTRRPGSRVYVMRGLMRCRLCGRKIYGEWRRSGIVYYRCLTRALTPGSAVSADHPRTVNVREDDILGPLNTWLTSLFDRSNLDQTLATLLTSEPQYDRAAARAAARERLADAEARLERFQDAIATGVDPAALVEAINQAQAQRAAARAQLEGERRVQAGHQADVRITLEGLGDVGVTLAGGTPEARERIYRQLRLELLYQPVERVLDARINPRIPDPRQSEANTDRVHAGTSQICRRFALGPTRPR